MADTDNLGAMLHGVSQQSLALRKDGEVSEQINFISSITKGLTSRPGAELVSQLEFLNSSDWSFEDFELEGTKYIMAYSTGNLKVFGLDGTEYPVEFVGSASDYLGSDMRVYVYDSEEDRKVFLLNRDKVVSVDQDFSDDQAKVIQDVGLVQCLGGLFSHTYTVSAEGLEGTISASYTAPDGLEDGDASKTTSNYIIQQISAAFNSGSLPAGVSVTYNKSVLMITGLTDIVISTEDGSGGDTLIHQTSVAKSTNELASLAPEGTLVKVVGVDGTEDDFWMRFDLDKPGYVPGTGFGISGIWREWYNPNEPRDFDATTMPHSLTKTEDGFSLDVSSWYGRRVGDEETNPMPSFVGKKIRDIEGFHSRLVFVAGPNTIKSVTNEPTDFFKKSAVADVQTDPVDMLSTAPNQVDLEWIIPFDRDLVLTSAKHQFHVSGRNQLTPKNSSLVQTTEYEISLGCKPKSTGSNVLLPFSTGEFSGVREFFSSNSAEANQADSLTETLPRYISGRLENFSLSTNYGLALMTTTASKETNSLWAYKYYSERGQRLQSAWSKWQFPCGVCYTVFEGSAVYIVLQDDKVGYYLSRLKLDFPEDPDLGYYPSVDLFKKQATTAYVIPGTSGSQTTFPWENAIVIQGRGCKSPGQQVTPISVRQEEDTGNYTYRFSGEIVPVGAEVVCGLPMVKTVRPSMPLRRDSAGQAMRFVRLVISRFLIYFEDSGVFSASRLSKYRESTWEQSNARVLLENDPDDPNRTGITTGVLSMNFGDRSDISELNVTSSDFRPLTISEIEWVGTSYGGHRKV